MVETIDFADVPYLEEVLNYLPINADADKEDVATYLKNVTNLILVNYGNEQYQFAYFGLHLLYMTYIYFSVRKISIIIPDRYKDAVTFAKPYRGQELDFNNIESAFDYSLVSEKDLPNILKIIELDKGQIGKISDFVDDRNEMAHANGRFVILNEDAFETRAKNICDSLKNIHNCMDKQIRIWFKDFLLRYCNDKFAEYTDISDIITEQMIQDFNLSINELLVCNEMSIKEVITTHLEWKDKLKLFKQELKLYCENSGYI